MRKHDMKKRLFIFPSLFIVLFLGCGDSSSPENETIQSNSTFQLSTKGYELYSWMADNQWNFTLITATNRNKTFEEIYLDENISSEHGFIKLRFNGIQSLLEGLEKIPDGETIFLSDDRFLYGAKEEMPDILIPDSNTVKIISDFCNQKGIIFQAIDAD